MGEVAPSRAFLIYFFGSFSASIAYHEKPRFSFNAPQNVFLWWVFSFGVGLPRVKCSLYPENHFSMGRIRLSFCMGVNRKRPLWLMVAP